MAEVPNIEETLRREALEAYREDYKELVDNWRSLESKAQGAVAIAGIFIAGAFAFIREIDTNTYLIEKILLVAVILFLITSVAFSVYALKIRAIAAPPFGANVERLVNDLLNIEDQSEIAERLPNYINDQISEWKKVNGEVEIAIESKAERLWRAQRALLYAILTIAVLTLVAILS